MAFSKITETDLLGKGVIGQPDTPGLTAEAMQASVEQVPREVIIPKYNGLCDALDEKGAAASLGAVDSANAASTVQAELNCRYTKAVSYSKAETNAAIDAKVVEIGTGDMAKGIYDPAHGEKQVAFADSVLEKTLYAGSESGSVKAADKLQTPRNIGAAAFDGTANITLAEMGVPGQNLLDNSDFAHPVNQRGVSGTISTAGYFLDRWKLVSGSVTIADGGITLNGSMAQILEYAAGTEAVCTVGVISGTAAAAYDDTTKTYTITSTSEGGAAIAHAKLEKGTVATPYVPKGYGVELVECLRYYQKMDVAMAMSTILTIWSIPNDVSRINVAFFVPMRINPTVTAVATWGTIISTSPVSKYGVLISIAPNEGYYGALASWTASADL